MGFLRALHGDHGGGLSVSLNLNAASVGYVNDLTCTVIIVCREQEIFSASILIHHS
jgi:hypothetical protein